MNTTNIIKLVACLAWVGVAVSSATPADARAYTWATGSYASCGNSYSATSEQVCNLGYPYGYIATATYVQQIKLVETGCSAGGCNADNDSVWTDMVYPTGRKSVSLYLTCDLNVYDLGSCAC
jgi:hypothetical protein